MEMSCDRRRATVRRSTMFCVSCGRATPNGATFCPGCGKQSQKKGPFTITCTYCRASNPYDAMFCWYCGRQLPREENIVDFIPFIPSPPFSEKRRLCAAEPTGRLTRLRMKRVEF